MQIDQVNSTECNSKENYVSYFIKFYNFYSYFGLTPVKIKIVNLGKTQTVEFIQNLQRKVIFLCTTILITLSIVILLWIKAVRQASEDKPWLSEIGTTIVIYVQCFAFLHFAWFQRKIFQSFLITLSKFPSNSLNLKATIFVWTFHICLLVHVTLYKIEDYLELWGSCNYRSPIKDEHKLWIFPKDHFMVDFLLVTFCLVDFLTFTFISSADGLLLLLALFFKSVSKGLQKLVDEDAPTDLIMDEYLKIKESIELANRAFSLVILSIYVASVAFYTTFIQNALLPGNLTEKIASGLYIILSVYVFSSAAEFHRIMGTCMRRWIFWKKSMVQLPGSELSIFLAEIHAPTVGLGCSFFTISYSLLGSMIGIILTYGIILYQLKSV